MDFLVLAQEGSNVEARKSLMLGHEHYAPRSFDSFQPWISLGLLFGKGSTPIWGL